MPDRRSALQTDDHASGRAQTDQTASPARGATEPLRPAQQGSRLGALRAWSGGTGLRKLAVVLGFFLVWQLASLAASNNLFPTPITVIQTLIEMIADGVIWPNLRVTMTRAFTGLAIAVIVGVTIGVAMARNRIVEATLGPFLAAFYPVPKLALYPVLILLFGFGAGSKIALVALECAYPIAYNTFAGVQGIRKQYFWVARNIGASRTATTAMIMRAASPSVLAGLRIALPIMLVIIVVTELLGESIGLGFLVRQAGTGFEPDRALAVILLLGIIGYLLDRLLGLATRRILFWQTGATL